jgi:hypothetical protein
MSNTLLTLGTFIFESFEAPEKILLRSKQRLVVHQLGSGRAIIDSLGEDYKTVSFSGIFYGQNAIARIRSLDYLRIQGMPQPLTWGSKSLSVLIQKFELSYTSNQWVPYKLSCLVLSVTNPIDSNPQDLISISPDVQLVDILGLLQSTSVIPTSLQTAAIVRLATLAYDVAPPDALQQARGLVGSVDTQLAIQASTSADADASASSSLIPLRFADGVSGAGNQAALVLVRNRLMSIIVGAENVNQ